MKKIISTLCITTIFLNLSACGTILYPERNNRTHSGLVDMKVAILDGIGLLFFIIPGVIAYVVDYNNGTIYLPYGVKSDAGNLDVKNMAAINVGKENLTPEKIQKIISQKAGQNIDIKKAEAYKIDEKGNKVKVVL